MPHQFTVKFESPLQVAEFLRALAQRGVDLRAIGLSSIDGQTAAVLTTSDDLITHEELVHGGMTFTEGEVIFLSVPDEPGALADVAERFLKADLAVHGIVLLRWYQGKAELAISVDNPDLARQVLAPSLQIWR